MIVGRDCVVLGLLVWFGSFIGGHGVFNLIVSFFFVSASCVLVRGICWVLWSIGNSILAIIAS